MFYYQPDTLLLVKKFNYFRHACEFGLVNKYITDRYIVILRALRITIGIVDEYFKEHN